MIITLCGSARFEPFFKSWNLALTLSGHTVFSLAAYPSDKKCKKDWYDQNEKMLLDQAHFRKIAASDAIFVINAFAYIGESTSNEIMYANTLGKRIIYLESWGKGLGVGDSHSLEHRALAMNFNLSIPTRSPVCTVDLTTYPTDLLCKAGPLRYKLVESLNYTENQSCA